MEKNIRATNVLLSRVLWRYDLDTLKSVADSDYIENTQINWKFIDFTRMRMEILERFEQIDKIPFVLHKFPKIDAGLERPASLLEKLRTMKRDVDSPITSSPFTPLVHFPNLSLKYK